PVCGAVNSTPVFELPETSIVSIRTGLGVGDGGSEVLVGVAVAVGTAVSVGRPGSTVTILVVGSTITNVGAILVKVCTTEVSTTLSVGVSSLFSEVRSTLLPDMATASATITG